MAKTILGVFPHEENANRALSELQNQGIDRSDISVIMRETTEGRPVDEKGKGEQIGESAVEGATTGGVIGGIAGLLAGVGAIAIPGFGAILVGGPLVALLGLTGAAATTASGAITGALAGGVIGALVGLGVPRERAEAIEERIKRGEILLSADAEDGREDEISRVFSENGANEITTITR